MTLAEGSLSRKEFIEKLVGLAISSYSVTEGCAQGDNVAGSLKAVRIVPYGKEESPIHIVFKMIPDNCPDWITQGQIYRTEHAFYRTLAPILTKFAKAHGSSYEPPIPHYFSGFNDDQGDYLCLEDLRPQGFIMPDKRVSLQSGEMLLILRELAKLHAVSYAFLQSPEGIEAFDLEQNIKANEELKYVRKFSSEDLKEYNLMVKDCFEETTNLIRDQEGRLDLAKRMENVTKTEDVIKLRWRLERNEKYFETLIHSDLWSSNLLIKYDDEGGYPVDVRFIDFQFIQKGNVFRELEYLFFTSTTSDYRREHLASALAEYFQAFGDILEDLGCPSPAGFTQDFLIKEFMTECYLPGLIHMTFATPIQLGTYALDGDEVLKEDAMHSLVTKFYRSNPLPLQRVVELGQEVVQLGLM